MKIETINETALAEVLRFEIEELKRSRVDEGLLDLPPDEGVCSEPWDIRLIRVKLNMLCSMPALRGAASALIAHEIEARMVKLRAIEGEAA